MEDYQGLGRQLGILVRSTDSGVKLCLDHSSLHY